MASPDRYTGLENRVAALLLRLADTANIDRESDDAWAPAEASTTRIATNIPCLVAERTTVVAAVGSVVRAESGPKVTMPAGTDVAVGDRVTITRRHGAPLVLTVTGLPITAMSTTVVAYCEEVPRG